MGNKVTNITTVSSSGDTHATFRARSWGQENPSRRFGVVGLLVYSVNLLARLSVKPHRLRYICYPSLHLYSPLSNISYSRYSSFLLFDRENSVKMSNCNPENPFLNPSSSSPSPLIVQQAEPDLLLVANKGVLLVTAITKYLSTLPHPIEIVEELVAVCAVTSTLLTSLQTTIERFPHLKISRTHSFVAPLCRDVLFAFKLLGSKVEEARRMRLFEPNDVGLVRLPRAAWTLVMGTEVKVAALRSRLYVEKYRVRVLIEAVSWAGLASSVMRNDKQDEELRQLQKMLPLIAERLMGVQKDYVPRLRACLAQGPAPSPPQAVEVMREVVKKEVKPEEPTIISILEDKTEYMDEKKPLGFASSKPSIASTSTTSLASTTSSVSSTVFDDSIFETWLLRCNPQKTTTKRRLSIFGIPICGKHTITPGGYYVKPVSSCLSEIKDLRKQCQGKLSEYEHQKRLKKAILRMHDDAQWEIQRLVEARENASSSDAVKRVWNVVSFMERPRRNISCSSSGRWRWFARGKEAVEWVLVLKGETLDHRCRTLPAKHEDPWSPKPQPPAPVQRPNVVQTPVQVQQVQQQQQQQQLQHGGTILRHIENRRPMSTEEAKRKMDEIVHELFIVQD
jgi:hypothetical protein